MSDNQRSLPKQNPPTIEEQAIPKNIPLPIKTHQEKAFNWIQKEEELKQRIETGRKLGRCFNLTSLISNEKLLNRNKSVDFFFPPTYKRFKSNSTNKIHSVGFILNQFRKPRSDLSIETMVLLKTNRSIKVSNTPPSIQETQGSLNWCDSEPLSKDGGRLFILFQKASINEKLNYVDVSLSKVEFEILNAFLYRKFLRRITEKEFLLGPESTIRHLLVILNRSSKRTEECYKFLLSKFFKFLKKKSGLTSREVWEEEEERAFYQVLFGDTADRMGLAVEEFYFPSKSQRAKKQNSLNKDYFAKIFKSNVFNDKLRNFMRKDLFEEHREDVNVKLKALFDKWMVKFKYTSEKRRVNAILRDIKKNKRLKFPWIYCELVDSVKKVEELMEQYERK